MEREAGQNQAPQCPSFSTQYLVSFMELGDFHIITGLQIPWGQEPHWPHLSVKPRTGMKPGTLQVSDRHLLKGGRQEPAADVGSGGHGFQPLPGAVIWMDPFIWNKGYCETCM